MLQYFHNASSGDVC